MKRGIKFRAWDKEYKQMTNVTMILFDTEEIDTENSFGEPKSIEHFELMQFTGLTDKNGIEIYEGDILEFADKWEWYKGMYGVKMHFSQGEKLQKLKQDYENEPMERRKIEIPGDYGWLLSSEIQIYWQVLGNIHQNPELIGN